MIVMDQVIKGKANPCLKYSKAQIINSLRSTFELVYISQTTRASIFSKVTAKVYILSTKLN